MKGNHWLSWLMLSVVPLLITGAPHSTFRDEESCPSQDLSITGGRFVLSDSYFHGSILRYICPEGYYPSVQTRRCREGRWDPKVTKKPTECKMITCPNPRVFENGDVTPYRDRYYVNDTTTYSCHSEFKFRGSAERVCKPNGKWSGSTPVCGHDSDHCPDPGIPPGSTRTSHMFNIDDTVTYRCGKGLTLIGSKERVCQEGGQWSGTEPQCYADFTFDTPDEVSEAFSAALKTNLEFQNQYEETEQEGKKITLDQGSQLDIYIAVDASGSVNETYFNSTKIVIKTLLQKISYYPVSPNYEILMFASEVFPIITMRNFKSITGERNLTKVIENLENFQFESKVIKSGTNIAKAYSTILESMGVEKITDAEAFLKTQHIVIMFTDGHANMGGSPKPKVEQIKHFITQNNPARESKLDLYVFGIGDDINRQDINDYVSEKNGEDHLFVLSDMGKLQETLDKMIDESTSVGLCGIYQDYKGIDRRRAFPWLAKIKVTRPLSTGSNCMGSLVTSSFILTAAHCLKSDDTPGMFLITLKKDLVVNVERVIVHPKYNITAKKHLGIAEYYEFDIGLIQLKEAVELDFNLRPICIPCTKETSGALKLSDSEGTCKKHEEILMSAETVNAAFMSDVGGKIEKKKIKIKQGKWRDACVEDAKNAEGITATEAKDVVSDQFLCSGGTDPTVDDVACKGDSGGATFVVPGARMVQVGVVSWGVRDLCSVDSKPQSDKDSRDYHTNLFSPKIRAFLQDYLGNNTIGAPLTFL